jgi:large conductance mechanosensitive channel
MLKEFRSFIMRGNVIDLAVAVIIGGAFSAIVGSLINDVITPLLLKPTMEALHVSKLENLGWNGVLYGKFLASVINFTVTAFIIFLLVKAMNRAFKKKADDDAKSASLSKDQELLIEIRDLLKKQQAAEK